MFLNVRAPNQVIQNRSSISFRQQPTDARDGRRKYSNMLVLYNLVELVLLVVYIFQKIATRREGYAKQLNQAYSVENG